MRAPFSPNPVLIATDIAAGFERELRLYQEVSLDPSTFSSWTVAYTFDRGPSACHRRVAARTTPKSAAASASNSRAENPAAHCWAHAVAPPPMLLLLMAATIACDGARSADMICQPGLGVCTFGTALLFW